ncbi:MAG: type II toxin-antitoxin system ParD family antitoxin [Alphaproteobacteria bacterium]
MNVSLPPQLEEWVKQKVASGLYTSASEVVREALRLLADYERRRSVLRRDIEAGIASGPVAALEVEALIAERRKLRKRAKR